MENLTRFSYFLVLCLFAWSSSYARQKAVSGKVTELESGKPVPGVNIIVKGTTADVATRAAGEYTIALPDGAEVFIFSSVGYTSREIPVNGLSAVDVTFDAYVQSLKETIVVGYGVQRRSEVTGSVSVVSGRELEEHPGFNALQSLRGKVSGVNISTNSGSPTGSNRVVIRGIGTINASANPLYIVDGVALDNIETMNPNDIQSIEVLKDASATAIYGSRGANGVILVTTKRGGTEKGLRLEYNGDFSLGRLARKIDVMNAKEFMEVQRIGYENAPIFKNYAPGQEPATRTALTHNHQLSIRSKGEYGSLGAFLNYSDAEGIYLNSWTKRASVKLVYDVSPAKWLSLGTNTTITKTWANNVSETGGGFHASRAITEVPPIFPVKWTDGAWSNSTEISDNEMQRNPKLEQNPGY